MLSYRKINAFASLKSALCRKSDSYAASLLVVGGYFLYTFYYALHVFIQFSVFQILLTGILFLSLMLVAEFLFNWKKFPAYFSDFGIRTFLAALLAIIIATIYSQPSLSIFTGYIRTLPFIELEAGAAFHQDTAYHVSLIQSIMNFGYPSTAQHGVPFNMYHVMSHSIDALILKITGLNPYDSYGLLYRFKTFLFVSAAVLFIGRTVRWLPGYAYIVSIVAVLPVIFSSWHGIGSHGLWMASLILLVAANYLYEAVNKREVGFRDYVVIFFIIATVSFAKISTGFILGSFVGICLFVRNYKEVSIYVFGSLLLLFFYSYSLLFQAETSSETSLSGLSLNGFLSFFSLDGKPSWYAGVWFLYFVIGVNLVWLAMYAISGNMKYLSLSLSGFVSTIVLYTVITIQKGLNSSEQWYFIYGIGSVAIVFFYMSVMDFISSLRKNATRFVKYDTAIVFILSMSLVFIQELPSRNVGFFDKPIKQHIWDGFLFERRGYYFNEVNALGFDFSAGDGLQENREKVSGIKSESWIYRFDKKLSRDMERYSYSRRDILMFVPQRIYDDEVASLGGPEWANGLLLYSLFGIPLAHGVERVHRTYGLSNYDDIAMRKEIISSGDMYSLCESHEVKGIIIVNSLVKVDYEIKQCTSLSGS